MSLLYLTFHSVRDALMIFSGVLFARVGGVIGLYVTHQPFTISAGVGFVALAGASMLEGLVLVSAIRDRTAHGMGKREAIEVASMARLRPVLMTGTVAALGFVPMMLSTGIGAEVQRPLATVVVFGMACDTFLTMLALPVLYLLFGKAAAGEPGRRGGLRRPRRHRPRPRGRAGDRLNLGGRTNLGLSAGVHMIGRVQPRPFPGAPADDAPRLQTDGPTLIGAVV